jgi:hypothetical protein
MPRPTRMFSLGVGQPTPNRAVRITIMPHLHVLGRRARVGRLQSCGQALPNNYGGTDPLVPNRS